MLRHQGLRSSVSAVVISVAIVARTGAGAATKPVDLDASTANGTESQCDLNVLQTFPVMIENRVTNRTGGDAFTFAWPSAGPGGFTSSVAPGRTTGVGATWVWTTNQSIFAFTGNACANDICFSKTAGPDPIVGTCSLCTDDGVTFTIAKGTGPGETILSWQGGQGPYALNRSAVARTIGDSSSTILTTDQLRFVDTPPAGTIFFYQARASGCVLRKPCSTNADCFAPTDGTCVSRGPFGVPGRSLSSNNVTVSAASLTSSLITFFSPPTEVFRVTSTAGPGGVSESMTNTGAQPVQLTIPAYPPGCCPANPYVPHQLRCGDTCVDYLYDPNNCGACGNVCAQGTYCWDARCQLPCDKGEVDCFGECVSLDDDDDNCGACGNVCGEGYCCRYGTCVSLVCDYPSEPYEWDLCGDVCVQTIVDNNNCGACGNVCGEGTCCNNEGGCGPVCGGDTQCGDQCADLENDSSNCGACGHVCEDGSCCDEGVCAPLVCGVDEELCGDVCVNTDFDPDHCGGCGLYCDGPCCTDGKCDPYAECGDPPPQHPPEICPNLDQTSPTDFHCPPQAGELPATCPSDDKREREGMASGRLGGPGLDAPVCETEETTQTIQPGQSVTTGCIPGGPLFREIQTALTVCGDGLPGVDGRCGASGALATTGTFNRLAADPTTPVGNAYVTPYRVHVINDTSRDGLVSPGESAGLVIETLNAGPMDITSATATLSAPEVDLSDDGVENFVGITVGGDAVSYGTILGTPAATNCAPTTLHPASNSPAIPITVPPDHPGDTAHPLVLAVSGLVAGEPFSMEMPLTLGIADGCDAAAHTRDFNGVLGLYSPMADLSPTGEPVLFPAHTFEAGKKRMLRLRLLCGSTILSDADVDPPEIVALSEATRGPIDVSTLFDERQNAFSQLFTWEDRNRVDSEIDDLCWAYQLRTSGLGTGTFTMTIRLAGRKDYVAGFVLE